MVRHVSGNSYPKNSTELPANSSRFFNSKEEAVLQPLGKMQLEIRELEEYTNRKQSHYITNANYDQSLIKFDSLYCTDSPLLLEHSFKVIMGVIGKLNRQNLHIFDIGCGQGELVMKLRNHGFNAFGYDPVLREPSAFLYATFFGENEIIRGNGNNLYILRCVLPHLEKPIEFIDGIFDKDPEAMIYIEWQSPDYIINSKAFYMVMHDHVNYFSLSTFLNYQTESFGQFGEWEYVLIRSTQRRPARRFGERTQDLDKKLERRGGGRIAARLNNDF
jgi:SAM-dependent methyltransferase